MSTGLECAFTEVRRDEWWYVLENRSDGEDEDWYESADAYGPFDTFDLARDHLRDNHANPGGYTVLAWHEGRGEPDAQMARLMKEASEREESASRSGPFHFR